MTLVVRLLFIFIHTLEIQGTGAEFTGCDFENGMWCGLTPDPTATYAWIIFTGTTPSENTGPDGDHTRGPDGGGWYAYLECSSTLSITRNPGDTVRMTSPILAYPGTSRCMALYYHVYGMHIMDGGELNVYYDTVSMATKVFSFRGGKAQLTDKSWHKAEVNIPPVASRVIIEAVRGGKDSGQPYCDIAIDDIHLAPGECSGELEIQEIQDEVSICTFEEGDCGFEPLTSNMKWIPHQGATPSDMTGAEVDHTLGNFDGDYMYIEASDYPKGETARMQSPLVNPESGPLCMVFYYVMFGFHIQFNGQLNIYSCPAENCNDGTAKLVWQRAGVPAVDASWVAGYANLPSSTVRVMIEGVKGGDGHLSDICIDDISFVEGECIQTDEFALSSPETISPQPEMGVDSSCTERIFMCYFNPDEACGQATGDWTLNQGQTPSENTGPDYDNSNGMNMDGYYAYTEISDMPGGHRFVMDLPELPRIDTSGYPGYVYTYKIHFWYHTRGTQIGPLWLYAVTGSGKLVDIFNSAGGNRSSAEYNNWRLVETFAPLDTIHLRFVSEKIPDGSAVFGDIAVDDVEAFIDCRPPAQEEPHTEGYNLPETCVSTPLKRPCDLQGRYVCQHTCVNVNNETYRCECLDGWNLANDGRNCQDVNECLEEPSRCGAGEKCYNVNGGFVCIPVGGSVCG